MKIRTINQHILINGSQKEATQWLIDNKHSAELIIADPDYKDIGRLLKTGTYENLHKILKRNHPLIHFTHNCTANSPNCIESMPYRLHDEMKKRSFRYRHQLIWQKYQGQKLNISKISQQKTSPPNDTDLIMIFMKGEMSLPSYINMGILCNKNGISSNILTYQADQKLQFKPADLCRDIILAFSDKNSTVLDTHFGGGNFALEAIKSGRRYIGIETDEKLFDSLYVRVLDFCDNQLNSK